jgi:hypothetical protein
MGEIGKFGEIRKGKIRKRGNQNIKPEEEKKDGKVGSRKSGKTEIKQGDPKEEKKTGKVGKQKILEKRKLSEGIPRKKHTESRKGGNPGNGN